MRGKIKSCVPCSIFEQLPGDLDFIPGGCPHAVQNLEDIHGLSMNYVDSSNYYLHLWTRVMNGDFRDFELMSNNDFPLHVDLRFVFVSKRYDVW